MLRSYLLALAFLTLLSTHAESPEEWIALVLRADCAASTSGI
jgi:hypothetical protein